MGERAAAEVDARADRRAPRARPQLERGDIPEAPEPRADVPPAANGSRARGAVLHLWLALVSARAQITGTHDAVAAHEPGERGGALPGRCRVVGSSGPRAVAGTARRLVCETPPHGRPHGRGVDALPCHPRTPSCPANQAAFWCMSRKREKEKVTIRVPNPNAPVKERLKTPSHKVHRSKRAYRRREKHPKAPGLD